MVARMFELMYEHKGVGLAANQVNLPYRLMITNTTGDPTTGDAERVYINPVLSRPKGMAEAEEGCLSIPGVHGDVKRAARIHVSAYSLDGEPIEELLDGLAARVVQHEVDHLDGVLFIDRLGPTESLAIRDVLEEFEIQFASRQAQGVIPPDQWIAIRLTELESIRA
jgi:peptide deformylase